MGLTDQAMDNRIFISHFAEILRKGLWKKAANHEMAKGAEEGAVDCTSARKLWMRFQKQGKLMEAQLLLMIATGGLWTGDRCRRAGYLHDGKCPLCGDVDIVMHSMLPCSRFA